MKESLTSLELTILTKVVCMACWN